MALTIAFVLFVVVVLASFAASLRVAEEQLAPAGASDAVAEEADVTDGTTVVEGEQLIAFDAVPPYAAGYDQWADVVDVAAAQEEFADDANDAYVTHDTFDAEVVLSLPAPRASGDDEDESQYPRSEAA
jgi:hypothetical protein